MPYTPPCRNDEHTAVGCPFRTEDVWIEEKHKSQTGVLDTCLNCQCLAICKWQLSHSRQAKAGEQSKQIMNHDNQEDILDKNDTVYAGVSLRLRTSPSTASENNIAKVEYWKEEGNSKVADIVRAQPKRQVYLQINVRVSNFS